MKREDRRLIAMYVQQHPEQTLKEISSIFDCALSSVCNYCEEFGTRRTPSRPPRLPGRSVAEIIADINSIEPKTEVV